MHFVFYWWGRECSYDILRVLNIRSLLNPLKYTAISDIADTRNIEYNSALTETWITPCAILLLNFAMLLLRTWSSSASHPRIAPANHAHFVCGGTVFLLWDLAVIVKSPPCPTFKTFDLFSVTFKLLNSKLTIFNVYRPLPATTNTRRSMPFSLFPTWKPFGFALAHLTISNSFALPQTNITLLLVLLRNASTPLIPYSGLSLWLWKWIV